ncbi:hypothetical protein ROA7450_03169 [Roseovarius albus]|uniref:Immunity MXAN-0049 protein domain-containing protein n=1 Tax=Roseovarius albus TaxID=1247867 RepID=A0A1X6ZTR5_9RHOB|nr:hypothetical protein ROA7450_03169 [Roseovarius albus]
MHQFWAVDVQQPRGKTPEKDYFMMVIGRYLDAFLPEKSVEEAWVCAGTSYLSAGSYKKDCNGLAVSRDVIGEAHLWRDRKLTRPTFFISDDLKAEIDAAGLRIFQHHKLIDV